MRLREFKLRKIILRARMHFRHMSQFETFTIIDLITLNSKEINAGTALIATIATPSLM